MEDELEQARPLKVYAPDMEQSCSYRLSVSGKPVVILRITPYRCKDGSDDCNLEFEIDEGLGTQEIIDVRTRAQELGQAWQGFIDALVIMGYRVQVN